MPVIWPDPTSTAEPPKAAKATNAEEPPVASSLFQLLCLSLLLSARIRSDIAVEAMRALRDAGWRDARSMAEATWKQRTDVLNRSGYARYDESTSRMLAATSELVPERYRGDLRRLLNDAGGDVDELHKRITECKGIGNVGADIFLREVQRCWDEVSGRSSVTRRWRQPTSWAFPPRLRAWRATVTRATFPAWPRPCFGSAEVARKQSTTAKSSGLR